MKVLTGTSRCLNGRFDAQLRSPTWRREDVGMLTSASQRFNWRTTAVRLANDGLSNLEETPRHVTCRQGKLLTKLTSWFIYLFFFLPPEECAFVTVTHAQSAFCWLLVTWPWIADFLTCLPGESHTFRGALVFLTAKLTRTPLTRHVQLPIVVALDSWDLSSVPTVITALIPVVMSFHPFCWLLKLSRNPNIGLIWQTCCWAVCFGAAGVTARLSEHIFLFPQHLWDLSAPRPWTNNP